MADESPDKPRNRDSIRNVLLVAVGVSFVCSVLVSATAVLLRPLQIANETRYRQEIVLDVAGLYSPGDDVQALFSGIDTRLVELASGDYVTSVDANSFDHIAAATDAEQSIGIPENQDVAGLRRRAHYAPVFRVMHDDVVEQIILPVYGSGLWSTMYGYLSIEPDGQTVRGLRFYEHAETPGLGDQVEKPAWRAQWAGKELFGADGIARIEVVRGQVQPGDAAIHQVDGLAGATLTGRGVTNLLRYWIGPHGFGPYLDNLRQESAGDD